MSIVEQILFITIPQIFFIIFWIIHNIFKSREEETFKYNYPDLRDLLPLKICEYCNTTYKYGENYCHLCGTGLKEFTDG